MQRNKWEFLTTTRQFNGRFDFLSSYLPEIGRQSSANWCMARRRISSPAISNESPWSHHVPLGEWAQSRAGMSVQPEHISHYRRIIHLVQRGLCASVSGWSLKIYCPSDVTFVPPRNTAILTVVPFSELDDKPISYFAANAIGQNMKFYRTCEHGHGKRMHYLPWIRPVRRECRSHRAAACRGNTLTSRCFGRRARAAWSSGPYWLMDELRSTQQRLEFIQSNHTMHYSHRGRERKAERSGAHGRRTKNQSNLNVTRCTHRWLMRLGHEPLRSATARAAAATRASWLGWPVRWCADLALCQNSATNRAHCRLVDLQDEFYSKGSHCHPFALHWSV